MKPDDLIPLGSLTKAYTSMGIMRLIESGAMGFNDTIAEHVDEILTRSNGTTLLQIWKGDQTINTVTIYQLLHMESGLGDYDDMALLEWTIRNEDKTYNPLKFLYGLNGKFICKPGTCEYYSGPGFVLLGLALA